MSFTQVENIDSNQDFTNSIFTDSIFINNISVNKKVCILYLKNGFAAERSFRIQDIINIYKEETGSTLSYLYLEITKDNTKDYENLVKMHYQTNIFISAIGSGDCKYLNDLFFENTEYAIHLNSYSTASYLKTSQKLLRIQIPDEKIPVVYFDLLNRENSKSVYIVTKNGTYYQGLTNDLTLYFEKEKIQIVKTVNVDKEKYDANDILKIAQEINSSGLDKLSVIFIVDLPMDLIKPLQKNDVNKILYHILISDSGAQQLPDNQELLNYIKEKNTKLITKFISDTQLQLALKYNEIISDSSHPVSSILSLTLGIIDLAENIILTGKNSIYRRRNYIDILLNENLDNTEAIWGIYSYKYNENKNENKNKFSLDLFGLSFYYGETVFTTNKQT